LTAYLFDEMANPTPVRSGYYRRGGKIRVSLRRKHGASLLPKTSVENALNV
ncbi:hypothetical protein ACTXT7_014843, partial [Hymenolepis weldensis]